MSGKRALYFGFLDSGHFLYARPGGMYVWPSEVPGLPACWTDGLMDTGLLKNGRHRDIYDGKVFWTCGKRAGEFWFAFFWWDRSGDSRGNSNSGFYVSGFPWPEVEAAFAFACARWPDVVKRQRHPLSLQITADEAERIRRAKASGIDTLEVGGVGSL